MNAAISNLGRICLASALVALTIPGARAQSADESSASAPYPRVVIETSVGDITVEVDPDRAPETAANFLRYVKSGFYGGTIFHRVIDNFMIQGGGFTKEMNQKTPLFPPIKLESRNGLKNLRGTVAMARTRPPDSATCQFFVNTVDNPFLDYSETTNPTGYAVFGRVVDGMDVVERIRKVKVVENPLDLQEDGRPAWSLPATPVVIKTIRLLSGADAPAGKGSDG
jgi:peptidyl-prolyl cis-trans isomerase A (cyclophilin A)